MVQFFKSNILQGTVAAPFRCNVTYNDIFVARCLSSPSAKEFWKLITLSVCCVKVFAEPHWWHVCWCLGAVCSYTVATTYTDCFTITRSCITSGFCYDVMVSSILHSLFACHRFGYDHFNSTKCQTKIGLDRQAGQIYAQRIATVSYTHLTLPTNREV